MFKMNDDSKCCSILREFNLNLHENIVLNNIKVFSIKISRLQDFIDKSLGLRHINIYNMIKIHRY
jgi:hypothetical protein